MIACKVENFTIKLLKKNNNKDIKVLFENVVMKKNDKEIVSEIFGYEPTLINSNLFFI